MTNFGLAIGGYEILVNQSNKQATDSAKVGWHGRLNVVFAHADRQTQIIHSQNQAPLKIQRPFYPEAPEICHSVILHTAGGVVGGDRLSLNFHLQPNAKALITTASAGKIYRSNDNIAKQNIIVQVETGACLEWLPQETIIFNGAIYRQDLRVELAKGASWLGWEITRFGRTARGERFLEGEWRSHTEIWQQDRPLWIDRQWLLAGEETINSPHGLANQPIVASLAWVGEEVSLEIVQKARLLWENNPPVLKNITSGDRFTKGEAGVTRLSAGLLCRYRGSSTQEVRNWFIQVWQLLRFSILGRTATPPRVWQI